MEATEQRSDAGRYAKCIEVSKRIRWDIDRDVIRGRKFDFSRKFLPDGISKVHELDFLGAERAAAALARSRAAPTPTCSGWSSASSAPRSSR